MTMMERTAKEQKEQADANTDTKTHVNVGVPSRAPSMHPIDGLVETVAPTNATVLIRGETGTGKELIANRIHYQSPRANGPFIKIHIASLPDTLIEAELFGREKGAYTGADKREIGRFERAHKGTLFLDEIGELAPQAQVKLLRVIQEREIERLGGNKPIKVDVRIIAATHTDLEEQVKDKVFREDLFYRLNVFPIPVPPLRHRREDIIPLVLHFCQLYARRHRRQVTHIDQEAIEVLVQYGYPGNIRELENALERAVVLAQDGYIKATYLPWYAPQHKGGRRFQHPGGPVWLPLTQLDETLVASPTVQLILDLPEYPSNGLPGSSRTVPDKTPDPVLDPTGLPVIPARPGGLATAKTTVDDIEAMLAQADHAPGEAVPPDEPSPSRPAGASPASPTEEPSKDKATAPEWTGLSWGALEEPPIGMVYAFDTIAQRDAVLYLAHQGGMTQRALVRVLGTTQIADRSRRLASKSSVWNILNKINKQPEQYADVLEEANQNPPEMVPMATPAPPTQAPEDNPPTAGQIQSFVSLALRDQAIYQDKQAGLSVAELLAKYAWVHCDGKPAHVRTSSLVYQIIRRQKQQAEQTGHSHA